MSEIVIGDRAASHIAFDIGPREYDALHSVDMMRATGGYRVSMLEGAFATLIYAPVLREFARDVEGLSATFAGEITFRAGEEHVADVAVTLRATESNTAVWVSAEVNNQPSIASSSHRAEIWFEMDRDRLEPLARALNALEGVL